MALDWLYDALDDLRRRDLLREPGRPVTATGPWIHRDGRELLNLCSNDYLSLAARSATAASGAGASRLVTGDLAVHRDLEERLATWLQTEATLLFSSGYAANVGTLAALAGPGTVVVSDALNHASIIDGCRLSRARVVVTPHRDTAAVERALTEAPEPRKLVATDAYFSMEGSLAPLCDLAAICDRHRAALYVDEAHALGVFGPQGRGASAAAGVRPDVLIGTFGKAFGTGGAFVAGSRRLRDWLWNAARSFVFSTGLAPACAAAALGALPQIAAGDATARLHRNAELVRELLGDRVHRPSTGPIIPILVGAPRAAVDATRRLLEEGLFVQGIRPPTVPEGTARLRLTVQADHDPAHLARAARAIREVLR
jgi:8-amino-7-oxononanoate synthase